MSFGVSEFLTVLSSLLAAALHETLKRWDWFKWEDVLENNGFLIVVEVGRVEKVREAIIFGDLSPILSSRYIDNNVVW